MFPANAVYKYWVLIASRVMLLYQNNSGENPLFEFMDFLDALNVVTDPEEEVVYTPGEDAVLKTYLENPIDPDMMSSMVQSSNATWGGYFYNAENSSSSFLLPEDFKVDPR
ncbi:hypothetical protein PoB_003406500 [Plakobranchus ocellatus]|uniref:Uncharacterized protein n=1 Tax=Plakobranchus ocellatus TaxID=259542 RepID=A0AAV4AL21_9GAST|nr:hypothetical protein PoB_003406500 [Plakobranchus ocellatus]